MQDKIFQKAFWQSSKRAMIFFYQDWDSESMWLPISLEPDSYKWELDRASLFDVARLSGYYVDGDNIRFVLDPATHPTLEPGDTLYIAGEFNGWQEAIGKETYQLFPNEMDGNPVLIAEVPITELKGAFSTCFRFVTDKYRWLSVPEFSPNLVPNRFQGSDFQLNLRQTGRHVFRLTTKREVALGDNITVKWSDSQVQEKLSISNAEFYLSLVSNLEMGVTRVGDELLFRVFAPRATRMTLEVFKTLKHPKKEQFTMTANKDGSWECSLPLTYDRHYYFYYAEGANYDGSTSFDSTSPIVDPYAKAMASSKGPGIVFDPTTIPEVPQEFHPPLWHDLVIAEVHLRDLMGKSKQDLSKTERQQYQGLVKWLGDKSNYLRELGVNALEFQPLQEFEYGTKDEYHWGYMPVNYFSPASCNAKFPKNGSQVGGFRNIVKATHDAGFAFILDVVYNHLGTPNALFMLDKHYYYELDSKFNLSNWSGVGNDIRCRSPMAKKLIIDSLKYMVTHMGVDGFRFDLGELIGRSVLSEIEIELKKVKPSVILIAEPWSFRGHIAEKMKVTGFSSWNDRYRDFFIHYLKRDGSPQELEFYMKGSPDGLTRFPAQTVNYSESHDDYCWMDLITENQQRDGSHPTLNDIRRTHLMFSMLFMSLGIPMVAGGQDFLRSKHGVRNTYQRGDINALDYSRLVTFSNTHEYARQWIKFRLGDLGGLLRLEHHPKKGYFKFRYGKDGGRGLVVLINANKQHGNHQLCYAINPSQNEEVMDVSGFGVESAVQIADHFRFDASGLKTVILRPKDGELRLPPLTCALWVKYDV